MSPPRGYRKRTARRHGHWSGPSGHHKRKSERSRVLAWDGEGFEQDDGSQQYGLLMNSDRRELCDTSGMRTLDLLRFMAAEADRVGRWVYHVGFGISYDVNMILGDVPKRKVRLIADGEPTMLGGRFVVRYTPAKSFWLKDRRTSASMTWYDTYGFHQTSFVRAAEKLVGASDRRLNTVREEKKRRGAFRPADADRVRHYTSLELEITVEMAEHTLDAMTKFGLKLQRLDGAGAVAAAMLRKYGVRQYMAVMPDEIHRASTFAYAGGRAEMVRLGYTLDGGWGADMRSAYPTMCLRLPCLAHGRWRRVPDGDFREPFALAEVRWDFDRMGYADGWLMPFPLRTATGSIYFPVVGHSWVWRPELDAARAVRRFADDDRLQVTDGWEWVPACAHRPFDFIPDVYEERRRMKDAGDPAEMGGKLGLNSLYGKTAQHVGGSDDKPPPFHQLEWAGYITSGTRARLFAAALKLGRGAVVSLMTDGILTTRAPEGCLDARVGTALGEWEVKRWSRLVSAQSGVYFYTDGPRLPSCAQCGKDADETPLGGWRCTNVLCRRTNYTAHFRGFNPDALDPDEILAAWARGDTEIVASIRHFYTMRECLRGDDLWAKWRTWEDVPRKLVANATGKRYGLRRVEEWNRRHNPSMELMDTMPTDPGTVDSWPYVLPWDGTPLPDAETEGLVGDKEQVSLQ